MAAIRSVGGSYVAAPRRRHRGCCYRRCCRRRRCLSLPLMSTFARFFSLSSVTEILALPPRLVVLNSDPCDAVQRPGALADPALGGAEAERGAVGEEGERRVARRVAQDAGQHVGRAAVLAELVLVRADAERQPRIGVDVDRDVLAAVEVVARALVAAPPVVVGVDQLGRAGIGVVDAAAVADDPVELGLELARVGAVAAGDRDAAAPVGDRVADRLDLAVGRRRR